LSRANCFATKNGFFIKDLWILKNLDLKNILIVDNLTHSFGLQIANGVPILEWTNDPEDRELKYLSYYLMEASQFSDVR
jgi:CTD small phosphatase-like protein 2